MEPPAETQHLSLKNHLLMAMPGLQDPHFAHSVTFICEHDESGCLGLVINKPLDMDLDELFSLMEIESEHLHSHQRLHYGGPVQPDSGLILHDGGLRWNNTLQVGDGLYLTSSKDVLEDMARGQGPDHSLVTLGYAGWGAGQLEQELAENAWLTTLAWPGIIFDTAAEDCYRKVLDHMGIDPAALASEGGQA